MKYLIFPVCCICSIVLLSAQTDTLLSYNNNRIIQPPEGLSDPVIDQADLIISPHLSLSQGFVHSEFEANVEARKGTDDNDIEIKTDYSNAMQYTVGNMEGIILSQGRFKGLKEISFAKLHDGRYVVYIFAGTTIVKAFAVEKQMSNYAAF
ncbi:MAG: hypothetical protein HKN76_17425 [Saprospiraceae bacterium]|nr:hypothetical protein [Saprospiraceae bacterium]